MLFYDFFQSKYQKQLKYFNQEAEKKGQYYIFFLHLTPFVPFHSINVLAGISTIRLPDFILGTIFGILPHALIYCSIGNLIWEAKSLNDLLSVNLFIVTALASSLAIFQLIYTKNKQLRKTQKY